MEQELAVLPGNLKAFAGKTVRRIEDFFSKKIIKIFGKALCIVAVMLAALYVWKSTTINNEMLYGRANYQDGTYGEKLKIVVMLIAFVWLIAFVCVTPGKKIPFITRLGQNTFSVFLCHGFAVRYLTEYTIFTHGTKINLLKSAGIALLLVVVFGNPFVGKVFNYIFMGKWIERWEKKKSK